MLNELIIEKNTISDTNYRKNDIPMHISKATEKIEISGRLSNPGSDSKSKSRPYTGSIGHDPNIGQLSIIAKTIRSLGHKDKIVIINHDLRPRVVNEQKNKFIKFANFINFGIKDCSIQNLDIKEEFDAEYFKYEIRDKEKIASILAQNLLTNKGYLTIFENHGGCEKSFIDLNADSSNQNINPRYIPLAKNITKKGGKIPDLVMLDPDKKEIYSYEGKIYSKINDGFEEIKRFDLFEDTYLKIFYPKYSLNRVLIIEGGPIVSDSRVKFQLSKDSQLNKKDEFI